MYNKMWPVDGEKNAKIIRTCRDYGNGKVFFQRNKTPTKLMQNTIYLFSYKEKSKSGKERQT